MACCCGGESYCCWDKDPTVALAVGESPAVSACQATPCAGMSDAFPNLMRYKSGPHASDAECAAACANVTCYANYPVNPSTQLGPDIRNWIYGLQGPYSSLNFSIAAGVNNIVMSHGIVPNSGRQPAPTRFLLWDYGDYDADGNVLRPRTLLGDSGWLGGNPPSCSGSWPYNLARFQMRVNKAALPTPSCLTVQVISPCNTSDWGYQILARII